MTRLDASDAPWTPWLINIGVSFIVALGAVMVVV